MIGSSFSLWKRMSIGQEAMQAPQYMQIPLFTTSDTRLPNIFSFFGSGFQPSPSTLDFSGTGGGAAVAGLATVWGGVCPAGGFAAGVAGGGGVGFSGGRAGGAGMSLVFLLLWFLRFPSSRLPRKN